jgi:hypothetical protein
VVTLSVRLAPLELGVGWKARRFAISLDFELRFGWGLSYLEDVKKSILKYAANLEPQKAL